MPSALHRSSSLQMPPLQFEPFLKRCEFGTNARKVERKEGRDHRFCLQQLFKDAAGSRRAPPPNCSCAAFSNDSAANQPSPSCLTASVGLMTRPSYGKGNCIFEEQLINVAY